MVKAVQQTYTEKSYLQSMHKEVPISLKSMLLQLLEITLQCQIYNENGFIWWNILHNSAIPQ